MEKYRSLLILGGSKAGEVVALHARHDIEQPQLSRIRHFIVHVLLVQANTQLALHQAAVWRVAILAVHRAGDVAGVRLGPVARVSNFQLVDKVAGQIQIFQVDSTGRP
ncbi:hypothetical protein D9M71_615190 [compost metagenome]